MGAPAQTVELDGARFQLKIGRAPRAEARRLTLTGSPGKDPLTNLNRRWGRVTEMVLLCPGIACVAHATKHGYHMSRLPG